MRPAIVHVCAGRKPTRGTRRIGALRQPVQTLPTLCGAERTAFDWLLAWVLRSTDRDLDDWNVCAECRALIRQARSRPIEESRP